MCEITWDKIKDIINRLEVNDGYAVIMLTDKVKVSKFQKGDIEEVLSEKDFTDKLLDMRLFDSKKEFRIVRGDVGRTFTESSYRILRENEDEQYEDTQYIDVRAWEKCCSKENVPEKVKIINHIKYDASGHAYIYDWRISGFLTEGGKSNGWM